MWCSSNHWSTPTCANPSAPPPSSATPIRARPFSLSCWFSAGMASRAFEAGTALGREEFCATAEKGISNNSKQECMRSMSASSAWLPVRLKLGAIPSLYEPADSNKRESSMVSGRALQDLQGGIFKLSESALKVWSKQGISRYSNRLLKSGRLFFLKNVAAVYDEHLAGDVRSLGRRKEANGRGNFIRCARAAYRRMHASDALRLHRGSCRDPAGSDGVDCDTHAARLEGDGAHHSVQCPFSSSVCC